VQPGPRRSSADDDLGGHPSVACSFEDLDVTRSAPDCDCAIWFQCVVDQLQAGRSLRRGRERLPSGKDSIDTARLQCSVRGPSGAIFDLCVSRLPSSLRLPLCAQVKITQQGNDKVSVEIDGKPFTDFIVGPQT